MISLRQAAVIPSEFVLARSRKMLCRRINDREYKVTPIDGAEHSIKRVSFVQVNGATKIKCEDYKNGRPCDANWHGNLCCHVFRVVEQIRINELRKQRREQRAA